MRKLFLCLTIALMASCAQDFDEAQVVSGANSTNVSSKLVNDSRNAKSGELIVRFSDEAIEQIENAVLRSEGTRSGIATFDLALDNINVRKIERLFPVNKKTEALKREAGLHRWYVVSFDEGENLDKAAEMLASVAEVEAVQFDEYFKLLHDGKFYRIDENDVKVVPTAEKAIFNDPQLSKQWHYINIGDQSVYSKARAGADVGCEEAWKLCGGDPSVVVAVVDHSVDWAHPDLAANMWVNEAELNGQEGVDDDGNGYVDDIYGYNFVTNESLKIGTDPTASIDHGTHVAGTIAAVNNNNRGVCGIAGGTGNKDGVRIMSCQVFYNKDGGNVTAISRAINYAAENGAVIIQASLGEQSGRKSDGSYRSVAGAELDAIDYFIAHAKHDCSAIDGGLCIFAAGNEQDDCAHYPGAYRKCISVSAISCDYTPAYYTNYGPGCNIAAPGGDFYQGALEWRGDVSMILSTVLDKGYAFSQGTSMACPHASGVAALGLAYAVKKGKHFSNSEFTSMFLASVDDVNPYCVGKKYKAQTAEPTLELAPYKGKMGTGLTDAYKLMLNIDGTPYIAVGVGENSAVDISSVTGGVTELTLLKFEIETSEAAKIGLKEEPKILSSGKLRIKCEKSGAARVKLHYIAGGENLGSESATGGMEVVREFVIVSRGYAKNGGWF